MSKPNHYPPLSSGVSTRACVLLGVLISHFWSFGREYSSIAVVLLTDESLSNSTLARITTSDGIASLDYMYLGQPDILIEDRSRMHHGATSLRISGSPCSRLRGRYWTDRDSKVALDFTEHRSDLASDYEDAERLFLAR